MRPMLTTQRPGLISSAATSTVSPSPHVPGFTASKVRGAGCITVPVASRRGTSGGSSSAAPGTSCTIRRT